MKKHRKLDMYAGGGSVNPGLNIAINTLPALLNGLTEILDSPSPNSYSRQPIVNAATIKGMATPYSQFAFGGTVDDLSEEELAQVQEIADENGISVEDALVLMQQDNSGEEEGEDMSMDEDETEEGDEFAMGGKIYIKPKNRGKFNATKKKTGKTTEQLTHSKNPLTRKRAVFAQNAAKWKHGYGGYAKVPIEVEGNEAIETPDGKVTKIKGPKHESGGVDVDVPSGTKIYSDRIKVGGQTMQERKIDREKQVRRIQNLITKDPTNVLLKNTFKRTVETTQMEEDYDMAIQEAVNNTSAKFGYGGMVSRKKYAFGGDDPYYDKYGWHYPNLLKSIYQTPGFVPELERTPVGTTTSDVFTTGKNFIDKTGQHFNLPTGETKTTSVLDTGDRTALVKPPNFKGTAGIDAEETAANPAMAGKLGVGDYVGLFGNLFNAVAPIINTRNNAKNMKPNINRYLGFGERALADNQKAQDYTAGVRSNALTDINTAANTAYARNRNSAQGVNTVRALDIATDMVKGKQVNSANDSFSKAMIGLLGQRGQLHNLQDKMEMTGETARDLEDKADMDNFYSNMAENLVNFGTNIQGIGKNLNTAKSNRVDARLISQLSRYGLGFDDSGNLISTKKS